MGFGLKKHSEKFDSIALRLGRTGFVARGFVWASVGGIAMSAAFTGVKAQGTQGALEIIASGNGGVVFLILVTLGILCYSSWRFFEGAYGLKIKPDSGKFANIVTGVVTPFASGIAYLIFAISNIVVIVQGINPGGDSNDSTITQAMRGNIAGKIVFVLGGVVLFLAAIMWIVDLFRGKWLTELDMKKLNKYPPIKIVVISFGYLGFVGRAFLFSILATLILRIVFEPNIESGGFGHALAQLQNNTFGRIVLVFTGFFMVLFGGFSVGQAFFKQFFFLIISHIL